MCRGHNNSPYMMYLPRMCAQTARDQGKKTQTTMATEDDPDSERASNVLGFWR